MNAAILPVEPDCPNCGQLIAVDDPRTCVACDGQVCPSCAVKGPGEGEWMCDACRDYTRNILDPEPPDKAAPDEEVSP